MSCRSDSSGVYSAQTKFQTACTFAQVYAFFHREAHLKLPVDIMTVENYCMLPMVILNSKAPRSPTQKYVFLLHVSNKTYSLNSRLVGEREYIPLQIFTERVL